LTVGLHSARTRGPQRNGRNLLDVVSRPDSDHAWYGKRRLHVNVNEYAVRDLRAYDPHGELTRKIYVIRKQALTADERRILQPWHWMPKHAALPGRQWRYRIAGLEDRGS
jgi:hypothetical protein